MITAFSEEHFAYHAKKIIVDIDEAEIKKLHMPDTVGIVSDICEFVELLVPMLEKERELLPNHLPWLKACRKIKERYPLLSERQDDNSGINLYAATEIISRYAAPSDVLVFSSTSRCNTAGHIAFHRKQGQKSVSSMAFGSMGFALPSSVGAYYAALDTLRLAEDKNTDSSIRVVMLEGDGSLQLNLQEMETIISYSLPVKMFIFSNHGYAAITAMQERNFNGHYVGSNELSGLFMPDLGKIAEAYGLPYDRVEEDCQLEEKIKRAMETEGPYILDLMGSLHFDEIPKCISSVDKETGKRVSAYLENPYPFLAENELEAVMKELTQA